MLATVSPHTVKRLRTDGAVGQLVNLKVNDVCVPIRRSVAKPCSCCPKRLAASQASVSARFKDTSPTIELHRSFYKCCAVLDVAEA